MKKFCRVCGNKLFEEPLITLKKMPSRVQNFPDKKGIKRHRGIDLKVFQCSGCGLVQLNCKPVSYYKEVIRAVGVSEEMKIFRREYFKDFIDRYALKNKKILEVGCGKGDYLSILNQLSAQAFGLEYSENSVKECKKAGLQVVKGFIENKNYKIVHSPFDAFLCLNFLEHIPFPNEFLRGIWNNLTEDAVGIIEVPSFDILIQKKLLGDFLIDHLLYFSESTLKNTLEFNGFEILEIKKIWYEYLYSVEVRKRRNLDLSFLYHYLTLLKNKIHSFIASFQKVALWGAGHQALSYISLLELQNKVRYIVDSASFKQNKYTPVTHIPIVSPEKLLEDPVDAVIVIVGGYSDEVVNTIKDFGINITVGVLKDYSFEILTM